MTNPPNRLVRQFLPRNRTKGVIAMLVLSRKSKESIVIGNNEAGHAVCTVTVLAIQGGKVKLGFQVDSEVPVHRSEVR